MDYFINSDEFIKTMDTKDFIKNEMLMKDNLFLGIITGNAIYINGKFLAIKDQLVNNNILFNFLKSI